MKEKIQQILEGLGKEDLHTDIWDYVPDLDMELCNNDFETGLIRVDCDSDSYIVAIYRSNKLGKSIVMDWCFRDQYESQEALIDAIIGNERDGQAMEHALEYSQEKFTDRINAGHKTRESKTKNVEPER